MGESNTRGELAYRALRRDILAGRLRSGDRLPFADLGHRYQASQGVLREALARLVAEGLVLSEPQIGFRVMPLSARDLDDLTFARCEIEGLVLRLSVEHGDLAWESELVAAHHRLDRTPETSAVGDSVLADVWATAHEAFHRALLAGCPNQRLVAVALSMRASAEVYRQWSVSLAADTTAAPDRRDIAGEHRALLDAALRRDAPTAVSLLVDHLRSTQARVLGPVLAAPSTNGTAAPQKGPTP